MANISILFSGQGSQYSGMGKELYDNFDKVREIYKCGSDILGIDIAKLSFNSTDEELSKTIVSQPAIFTLSVSAWEISKELVGIPSAVAGHSLGEFAALYAAGAYSLEDGFRLIGARAKAMEKGAVTGNGSMYAIIGSTEEKIKEWCNNYSGKVMPVNFNISNQTVISGEVSAAAEVAKKLEESGAKVVKLGVSSAFHTPMMQGASEEFASAIQDIKFSPTTIPFYSNVTGDKIQIDNYTEYLAKHMVSPVRFVEQVAAMVRDNITAGIEFGPKKTVATLAKKNHRKLDVHNVENTETYNELAGFLAKL